ncbi:MFS transporter [Peribacillus castrilensis]|uniref:MFS transporter n=1 Tax=Peribacillus TaxID=2675229 RepID=UPI0007BF89D2|nr:MFS transporter [Peribacillus frigoritolerans]MEB2493393.1 MFS transporter [Peribacillus frigoritolerans]MEE3952395.1 MFS transporter [Peribacillus frigoritolerans]
MANNTSETLNNKEPNIFKNRVFQAIIFSGLFLQIGIWVRNFAVLLFVMEKTNGDAFAISMISVAEFAPIFIFSFIGGTFADRWSPKKTMVWCDILSAISVFAVLISLIFGSWKMVFFATLISAILSQFSQPSGMKLFKMHLPESQIQTGMSVYQTVFAVFMVLGPILGTFAFQSFGINTSIAITGLAFLLSAGALAFLPKDRKLNEGTAKTTLWQEMKSGVSYVLRKKELSLLGLCFLAAGLGLGFIQPLSIFLVTEQLELPKENLQWLFMVNGFGMILGGAGVMIFAKKVAPQRLLAFGMLVNAIGLAVMGLSTNLWITLTAEFFNGLMLPCIQIGINTLILQRTEGEFIGRVNGILSPLFTGSMVLTMSAAGVLKEQFSLVAIFETAAFFFILGMFFILPLYNQKAETKPLEVQS